MNPVVTAASLHETGLAAWPVGMRYALALANTFAVVVRLWVTVPVFTPAFLVLCMALTLYPVSQWLVSRKVPATLTASLNIVLMFAVMLDVTGMMVGALTAMATELPRYQRKFQILYQDSIHLPERPSDRFNIGMSSVTGPAQRADPGWVTSCAGSLTNSLDSAGTTMFHLTMLVTLLVGDLVVVWHHATELATCAPGLAISLRKFARGARMYFLMATFFDTGVIVPDIVVMHIFEVSSLLARGILAFMAGYIPVVGFIISMIPPVLVMLVTQDVGSVVGVTVSFIVISAVVFDFVRPHFTGSTMGLDPTISFLSLMAWSTALGLLGAVASVPMILFIKAIFADLGPCTIWIDALLRPSSTPPIDLLRRKRDCSRDGCDDRIGEAVVVDWHAREQQVHEAAEMERQCVQTTTHELNEAAQAEINRI